MAHNSLTGEAEPVFRLGENNRKALERCSASKGTLPSESSVEMLPEPLGKADRKAEEKSGRRTWARPNKLAEYSTGQKAWMDKLRKGDLSGPEVPKGSYLNLRNEEIKGNPRSEPSYKQACCEAVGFR